MIGQSGIINIKNINMDNLFERSFELLSECIESIDGELSEQEQVYRKMVVQLCSEIGEFYEPTE